MIDEMVVQLDLHPVLENGFEGLCSGFLRFFLGDGRDFGGVERRVGILRDTDDEYISVCQRACYHQSRRRGRTHRIRDISQTHTLQELRQTIIVPKLRSPAFILTNTLFLLRLALRALGLSSSSSSVLVRIRTLHLTQHPPDLD